MNVYIVCDQTWDGDVIDSIWSTPEKAMSRCVAINHVGHSMMEVIVHEVDPTELKPIY